MKRGGKREGTEKQEMKGNREERGETVEDKRVVNAEDAQTNIDTDVNRIDTHDAHTNVDTHLLQFDPELFSITVITINYIGTILGIHHTAVTHRTLNDPLESDSDCRFDPPFPVIDPLTTCSLFSFCFPFETPLLVHLVDPLDS